MNRSTLIDLLTRYEAHACTPEESRLVEQWYELLGEPIEIPLTEEQWVLMEQKLWRKVQPQALEDTAASAPFVRPLWRRAALVACGVAALMAITVGLNWNEKLLPGWFGRQTALVDRLEQNDWTQYVNETGKPEDIRLPDGSCIVLSPDAQLAVHKAFNKKNRDVRLLGEASFDVHRDPSRPFLGHDIPDSCGRSEATYPGDRSKRESNRVLACGKRPQQPEPKPRRDFEPQSESNLFS
jgi:transmembrane sensor